FIDHIPTERGRSGGLVLESGLNERWIFLTYEDEEVALAANIYQATKQESQGWHFLLIQPDDSGRTFTGFWLLKQV
ncbi:MAG: Tab2 family RNA-binding protein, partial [Microcystis sp.]